MNGITTGNIISWSVTIGIGAIIIGLVKYIWNKELSDKITLVSCRDNQKECKDDILITITEFMDSRLKNLHELFELKIDRQVMTSQQTILDEIRRVNDINKTTIANTKISNELVLTINELRHTIDLQKDVVAGLEISLKKLKHEKP